MKNYIIIITLLFGAYNSSMAQEPDLSTKTITWNCINLSDSVSGNFVTQNSQIITGPSSAKWLQIGSDENFTVSSRDWNWSNGTGSIIYQIDYYGLIGELKIQNNGTDTFIIIYLDEGKVNYKLEVNNYSH